MPYLYRQAVISHEEGIPMMRPMFVEFPQDRACETLDRQYMLGESLLVAPIFKENGEVEYYVPEGRWYNLLTGQTVEGGKWQKEVYDYFHMPLLARPNSILAVGNNSERPDYDYTEQTTLYFVNFEDGKETEIQIPDLKGHTVAVVAAKREGDLMTVKVTGKGTYKYEVLGGKLEVRTEKGE